MRKLRQKAYQDKHWRALRNDHMHKFPLCDDCLSKGKITPAVDVHHKRSPFINGTINYTLLLDDENLVSLCKECHGNRHAEQQGHISPEEILKQLDALFDETITDEELEAEEEEEEEDDNQ